MKQSLSNRTNVKVSRWFLHTVLKFYTFKTNIIYFGRVALDFNPSGRVNEPINHAEKFFVYTYFILCYIVINFVCMQMVIAVIVEAYKV